ncbi:MAG: DUF4214 domain-containing protein [Vicinamibacteria bacterium]
MNHPQTFNHRIALGSIVGLAALLSAQIVEAQPQWGRPNPPRSGVCFYRDPGFSGDFFCANAGQNLGRLARGMSDQISSIRFFGNAEVTVYQLERFGGRSIQFDRDVRNLRSTGWNESLSSVRVTRGSGNGQQGQGRGQGDNRGGRYGDRSGDNRAGDGSQANVTPRAQDVDEVIRRVYLEVLRRDADGAGLTEYRTRFANDRWTEQDLRHALETSEEYRVRRLGSAPSGPDPDATVRRLYQEVLKRDADATGLRLYGGHMRNDRWSEQDVRDALTKSTEYRDRSVMTMEKARAIVTRAYRSELNRDPGPAADGWVDKVFQANWTEADLVRELRKSPEYLNKR